MEQKELSLKIDMDWINTCVIMHLLPSCIVSEPDPRKIEKEGLVNGAGWRCTLRNVRNFINCLPSVAS